jgi:hypothetical protein
MEMPATADNSVTNGKLANLTTSSVPQPLLELTNDD